jgi:hypothetical protein
MMTEQEMSDILRLQQVQNQRRFVPEMFYNADVFPVALKGILARSERSYRLCL